ncbi:MAG: RNA 2',3'-cyclic phosphodiesterase [Planctomycetaceae bacterium]
MNRERMFVAVGLRATPPLRKIAEELAGLGKAVRALDPDDLHLTLKFLGDTQAEFVPEIARIVETCAATESSFTARIAGLGAFPHADRPSVVWAGLDDAEPLVRMADSLEQKLAALGFPEEARKYHPHVTLARVRFKPPAELGKLLEKHPATAFGDLPVRTLGLYQSELRPEGSRYTVLASAALA